VSDDSVESLASLVARRPLGVEEALAVLRDLAGALRALHAQGKAHGAVGQDTVVFDSQGVASLVPGHKHLEGREPDPRSDICALGATIEAALDRSEPIPEPLERLLATMTSPEPSERPRTIDEVLLGLDACELMCGRRGVRPGQQEAAIRARQRLLPLVVALLALLVLGAAALTLLGRTPPPRGEPPESLEKVIEKASSARRAP